MRDVSAIPLTSRWKDFCFGALAMAALAGLLGWSQGTPETLRAQRFEVIDKDGKVRARVEPGLIALFSASGKQLARLTADETNGNLVLQGADQKRLEVFMDPNTPRAVFYDSSGKPTGILPPP